MDQKNNNKKRLSKEATNIVIETSRKVTKYMVEKELNYLRENLSKIITDYILNNKLNIEKEINDKKADFTDKFLKKYLPLKNKIKQMEDSFFNEGILDEAKFKKLQIYMQESFIEKPTEFDGLLDHYIGLVRIFTYLDTVITNYIKTKENDNKDYEESLLKEENQRFRDEIYRNNCKIYILEHYYKENMSAKIIKQNIYENERRFSYDKKDLLYELTHQLSTIYEIVNIFL